MIDFRTPLLNDKERFEHYTVNSSQLGCDVSFATTYLWRIRYDIRIAFSQDTCFKAYYKNGQVAGYSFPITTGDKKRAAEEVLLDAKERGIRPVIGLLNEENARFLKDTYDDRVRIEEERDAADYIYRREDLATLSGKKYHAKRNHISRFLRLYGDDYSVEELNERNLSDALSVCERWQRDNDDTGEFSAIKEALGHLFELSMFGLVLYVGENPVAMTLASAINSDIADVSFEKAVDIDEAYAVINNEFAKHFDTFTYLNREEDLGVEGLRKAKLSYHPEILYMKHTAYFE